MTDNPYVPPTSRVENSVVAVPSGSSRPGEVTAAVWLLSVYIALAVPLASLLAGIRAASLTIALAVMLLASLGLVIRNIARGQNWARLVMLVFYCLSALMSLAFLSLPTILTISAVVSGESISLFAIAVILLQIVQIVAGGLANYFLFARPGRFWFRQEDLSE